MGLGLTAISQDSACGQVPMAKVDSKAQMSSNLATSVEKNLSDELKTGEFKGVFKVFVDCKGAVYKCDYQKGDILENEVKSISKSIEKSTWKPAYIGHESTNSIVFITVNLILGKAEIIIQ